jgi:hypothetical protein
MNYKRITVRTYLNSLYEISGQLENAFSTPYINYSSGSGFFLISSSGTTIGIPVTGQDKLLIYKNGN